MPTSTLQFCRPARFRRHASGTCPLRGPWLIGLPRINPRLWAAVSHRISFAAVRAHVSHLSRTRRGREPLKLVLAALYARPLSPKELPLDSGTAHTGSCFDIGKGLDHSVGNSREQAVLPSLESKVHISNGDTQSIGEARGPLSNLFCTERQSPNFLVADLANHTVGV